MAPAPGHPCPFPFPCRSTVRKTESSLKRLKARQQGGEGGAGWSLRATACLAGGKLNARGSAASKQCHLHGSPATCATSMAGLHSAAAATTLLPPNTSPLPRPLAAAAPDTDKMIGQQLLLDVQEFGRQATQVCGGRCPSYTASRATEAVHSSHSLVGRCMPGARLHCTLHSTGRMCELQ